MSLETSVDITKFLEDLKGLGNKKQAAASQRYHKSHREHWGVFFPDCARLAKNLSKGLSQEEMLAFARALWATQQFDSMMCAAKILCLPKLSPSAKVWETLIDFLRDVDGWALEDRLAHVAWKCILKDERLLNVVEAWTTHENFWMRRAALVYTLPYAKPGRNPERMLQWAASYASDPEWFIQKAIGWWLRVLGEHNPERVCLFLKEHWIALKGVARREATRKLSPDLQKIFRSSLYTFS